MYNPDILQVANMKKTWFETQFSKALQAGKNRDYKKAIAILEDLAARGSADGADPDEEDSAGHPEIYLYLSRSWHAEKMYSRAAVCARSYIDLKPEDGSGWFFLGRSYFADGMYERAIRALHKSVSLNPSSIDARTLLGMACLKGRKPTLARVVFEEALALSPDDPRLNQGYLNALFVDAVRTYKRGDSESARQMLTFLINNDIDGVVPRLYLAHALRDLGYLPEALSQYEAAIQFAPDDVVLQWYPASVLLAMGETAKAAEIIGSLGETLPEGEGSDRMISMQIIRTHLEQKEWPAAAQAARSYIKTFGSDARVHALMGEAQRNLGNSDEALNHFISALEMDKQNPAPHYGIFMVLLETHDWVKLQNELVMAERAGCDAEIIQYYRVLCGANLDADPQTLLPGIQEQVHIHGAVPELVVALARTYFRLGLADLAVGWYQKAIEIDADDEEAHLGFIACCEELEDAAALRDAYRNYLAHWNDNSDIRNEFIRHLAANEQWGEAADQLETLSVFEPAVSHERQLAFFRRKAGQYRQAAILYRNMLRSKPDDRAILFNLVFCLDRMGETASSLALIHEANRVFKTDVESLLIEGRLLARSGDFDKALVLFRKVIDAFPRDTRGWQEIADIYRKQNVPEMAAIYDQKVRDLTSKKKKPDAKINE